jgi:hypothetical protein
MKILNTDLFEIEKRGGLLTILLLLWMIGNLLLGIFILVTIKSVSEVENISIWQSLLLAIIHFINVGIATYILNWKKLAVYIFWASSLYSILNGFIHSPSILHSLFPIIFPVILTLLIIRKWKYFK